MLFETLATFYCIVHTESKLTYRNGEVGNALYIPADKCYLYCNCAKNGKGAKFYTNEANTIQIKTGLGVFRKFQNFS